MQNLAHKAFLRIKSLYRASRFSRFSTYSRSSSFDPSLFLKLTMPFSLFVLISKPNFKVLAMEDDNIVSPIDWKDIPIHPKLAGLISLNGKDSLDVAEFLVNYAKLVDPEEATKYLVLARRIYLKHKGFNSKENADILSKLALAYLNAEEFDLGRQLLNKASELYKSLGLLQDHLEQEEYKALFPEEPDYERAKETFEQILEKRQELFGDDDPGRAACLARYAIVATSNKDSEKASKLLRESAKLLNTLDIPHDVRAKTYALLAQVHEDNEDYDLAIASYSASLKHLDPNKNIEEILNTYFSIGQMHQANEDYDLALSSWHKLIEMAKRIDGVEPIVARCYSAMGTVYLKQNKIRQAANAYEKFSNEIKRIGDYEAAISSKMYACTLLRDRVEFNLGFDCIQKTYDWALQVVGPDHPLTRSIYEELEGPAEGEIEIRTPEEEFDERGYYR